MLGDEVGCVAEGIYICGKDDIPWKMFRGWLHTGMARLGKDPGYVF